MSSRGSGLWRVATRPSDVGRYRLRAEIGRGGMGAVFVGEYAGSAGFRKRVAIKMLRTDRAHAPMADTLRREANTAVRLEHPHIAQIYDLSDAGTEPYVVMEYVHGESLASLIDARGALPYALVSWIGVCVCDALSYAHDDRGTGAQTVVHRDLSPPNILISYDGVPKLVDFGIAINGDPVADSDVVRGRLAYMSPEQRSGREVDGRADLYALGIVLYQLAVGAHPWQVAGREVDRPPHPGRLRADFPPALWRAISNATEPERAARVATARELLAMLRQCAVDTDGHDMREELARVMSETFSERRREKDLILASDLSIDSDTEALDDVAPNAPAAVASIPERTGAPPAPRRWSWRRGSAATAVLLAIGIGIALLAWSDRSPAPSPNASAATTAPSARLCVLIDPTVAPGERDATWAAARVVGLMLEQAGRTPVHGYRAQDKYGWTADQSAEVQAVCERAQSSAVVIVQGDPNGGVGLRIGERDSEPIWVRDPSLVTSARRAIERAGIATVPEAGLAGELSPSMDNRATILSLIAREDLVLEHSTDEGRDASDVLTREYPTLETPPLTRLIRLWWAGQLDAERAPRVRNDASNRTRVLRDVIVALSARDSKHAGELIAGLLEDRRYREDALVLYLAGEAFVHQGRPGEGVRYLGRAIARDPQFTPAFYHVFERRLAEGDTAAVTELADLWERVDPAGVHATEYRAHAALGAGDYDGAIAMFEELLKRDRALARENGAHTGLIYSLVLDGRANEATKYSAQLRPALAGPPPMSWVMVEPLIYALALDNGDEALAREWEQAVRARLVDTQDTANHWLLRSTMALLDALAQRADGRRRWVPTPPPDDIPRSYRFAAHRRLLAALENRGDPEGNDLEPGVQRLAEALELERGGELERAVEALQASMASSRGGEFDCISAAALARIERARGNRERAANACENVLNPRVPRAYCIALRTSCAAPISSP